MGNTLLSKDCIPGGGQQHLLTDNLVVTKRMNVRDVYDIVEVIGKGSISTIYKIRKRDQSHPKIHHANLEGGKSDPSYHDSSTSTASDGSRQHDHYALKEINLANIDPRNVFDFFQNEIEILRRLDHPNIVRAYEQFKYKSNNGQKMTGIVLELCEGGDLHSRAPYTEEQAGAILYKIVKAVHYMHVRSIMHLDIKMNNIMFESNEPDAEIKLIDFGLSAKFFRHENFDLLRGTIFYMAPEVLMGHYDYQADMWSIGVVAFILLSGEKPFQADKIPSLKQAILEGEFGFDSPAWKSVSTDAKRFVSRLLEYDPSLRCTAKQALKNKWLAQFKPHVDKHTVENVLSHLHPVPPKHEFEKLAWLVVARNATIHEIEHLREAFVELDQDRDGKINHAEFKRAMIKITHYRSKEVEDIFRQVDAQHAGAIDYTTFLAALLAVQGRLQDDRLVDVFDHFDVDHCGYITHDHLRQVLGGSVSKKVINRLIEEVDEFKDGKIGFEEFKHALT